MTDLDQTIARLKADLTTWPLNPDSDLTGRPPPVIAADIRAMIAATQQSPISGEGWRSMDTLPHPREAGVFWAAIRVGGYNSPLRWEVHLIAVDDESHEVHANYYQGWNIDQYEFWCPCSVPPVPSVSEDQGSNRKGDLPTEQADGAALVLKRLLGEVESIGRAPDSARIWIGGWSTYSGQRDPSLVHVGEVRAAIESVAEVGIDAIMKAYAAWPDDVRRKLSYHDIHRMAASQLDAASTDEQVGIAAGDEPKQSVSGEGGR